jgi:hypothetical protein
MIGGDNKSAVSHIALTDKFKCILDFTEDCIPENLQLYPSLGLYINLVRVFPERILSGARSIYSCTENFKVRALGSTEVGAADAVVAVVGFGAAVLGDAIGLEQEDASITVTSTTATSIPINES